MGYVNVVQEHYINIIDRFILELVAYQGCYKEIVQKCAFNQIMLWHCVLSCCGNFGDVQLGRPSAEYAMQLEGEDLCISHAYHVKHLCRVF